MTMSFEASSEVETWMELALEQARIGASEGEVPVGCVAVWENQVIARDHNRSIQLNDPTAHAEIRVLQAAGKQLGNYRLNGLELFVTLEPCPMCAGALIWARIKGLYFGARDEKAGAVVSQVRLLEPGRFNHDVEFREGVQAEAAREILRTFFAERR